MISIFIKVVIYSLRRGSLVVNHDVVTNKTNSDLNVAAATNNLINGGSKVTIGIAATTGASAALVTPPGKTPLTVDSGQNTLCAAFNNLQGCSANQECSINSTSGMPYCVPLQSTDNFALIVGLGVGIPLFFIALALVIVLCVYRKSSKSKEFEDDLDRTMPAEQGFFTGAIPGRFNSWNRQAAYPFNGRWDDESLDSDRGAYDNEMFRGKEPYIYDNNRGGKPDHFSWDFIFQSLPTTGQYRIKRPETEPRPNPVFTKKGGGTNA